MDIMPTIENQNSSSSVFDYFKEHTGLLIAIASSFVAIVSFVCNFLAYSLLRIQLMRWNIEVTAIGLQINREMYYYAVFSLVYCIAVIILNNLLNSAFNKYFRRIEITRYTHEFYKIFLRKRKEEKIQLRKIKKCTKRKKLHEEYEKYKETEERLDILSNELKELKLNNKKAKRLLFKNLMWSLFAFSLLLFFPVALMQLANVKISLPIMLISWLVSSAIIFSLSFIFSKKTFFSTEAVKHIRTEVNDAIQKGDVHELLQEISKMKDDDNVGHTGLRNYFSNEKLNNYAIILICSIVSMMLSVLTVGFNDYSTNTDFNIYKEDQKIYAVIYCYQDTYYLEEAVIDGDVLKVDISKQRILQSDDIILDYRTFSKVERITELPNYT